MGIVNDMFNDFTNRLDVFADLCNVIFYNGNRLIQPENLAEYQKFYHEDMVNRAGKKKRIRRERDVIKLLCRKNQPVIIAFENQDKENLYMPLRCMEYEAQDLKRQLRRLQQRYDKSIDLEKGAEFLSGIRRTDRFIPTAQIVLYHGEDKWDAPQSLNSMMDLSGTDEHLQKFITDYQIHVIHLTDLDENKFETGLRELIGMLKRRDDKAAMQAYCREHADRFSHVDDDTYDLICAMLHIKSLKPKKETYRTTKGGKIDMCKAFNDWSTEEQEKGRKIGKREGEKTGEQKALLLMSRLIQDKRFEEACSAVKNAALRNKLYLEYGI